MTNGLSIPVVPCCPENVGGDLMPLLLVIIVLLAGHIAIQEFRKRKGKPEMKKLKNLAIVAAVIAAVGLVFVLKHNPSPSTKPGPMAAAETTQATPETTTPAQSAALPRLVDLGADKCIPCKMMAPILEELKTTYAGQLEVEFIDVWKNEGAGEAYGVRVIPLQIFFDANGKELFRHEGFYAKADILAKWKELGFKFQ
ncbi:MAG: thioredoxin family protein [Kiritimatiellia bacterium]